MLKDKDFIDWFSENFSYGYGDGEIYIIPALNKFLSLCSGGNSSYDYRELEEKLGSTVAWLMINALCNSDIIEYGTSPRFGWLDPKGELLKDYMSKKTVDELYNLVTVDSDYIHCSSKYCNCGEKGYEEGRKCDNPLFK